MNIAPTEPGRSRRPYWNIALWTAQGMLAFVYLRAGLLKTTQPMEALAAGGMEFTVDYPDLLTRFIGTMELLGAVGILLPAIARILPRLTPLAALGLSAIQVLAIALHYMRGELGDSWPVNLIFLSLSLFVLWGRLKLVPIQPRSTALGTA